MTHELGLVIESLVAALLMLTIGYCTVLNRRLKRLRADEPALRDMIAELVTATETAGRAIGGLRLTVEESDRTLGERLRAAEQLKLALDERIGGAGLAAPIAASAPPRTPDANAMVAAANAFAERARARMLGRAA